MSKTFRRLIIFVAILSTLFLTACAAQPETQGNSDEYAIDSSAEEDSATDSSAGGGDAASTGGTEMGQTKVKLGEVAWTDCESLTEITARVLRDAGYQVEIITLDAGVLYQALAKGEVDAMVCSWQPVTHADYLAEFKDQIEPATTNMEGLRLGWAAPSYVEEVSSIEDLKGKAEMFGGRIVGIDPGAGLQRLSHETVDAYGLGEEYQLIDSSDAAMTAELDRAIGKEEPIVVTSWAPHIMWVKYDLKWLEDPKGVLGDAEHQKTMVRNGFQETSPRAFEILSQIHTDPVTLAGVMLEVQEGKSPKEAADNFIDANADLVQAWTE